MGGSYDVLLVLHPFRNNIREFQILTQPLETLDPEHLLSAEGLFNPKTDTALLILRFSEQAAMTLGPHAIHLFAGRSGLPMIVPAQLSPVEQRKFFIEHLTESYSVYVQLYPLMDEPISIVTRVLLTLADHIEFLPHIQPPADFAIQRAMPLFDPYLQTSQPVALRPPSNRLDSAS